MAFTPASRKGTHVLIGLTGHSGSGKTYSAIRLARGLVGQTGRIAVLDTERGRASHYSNLTAYDTDELNAPFSSARYKAKIVEAAAAGFNALIIDSFSHEWEGEGGMLEYAESQLNAYGKPLVGLPKWLKPKAEHKKLVNTILQVPMHVIICMRGKDKLIQKKDDKGKEVIVNAGVVPIQDSRFLFEMTVSLILGQDHLPVVQKCPGDLLAAFPGDKPLDERAGAAVAAWVNGGEKVDPAVAALKAEALAAANEGSAPFKTYWAALTADHRSLLRTFMPEFESAAKARDEIGQPHGGDDGESTAE